MLVTAVLLGSVILLGWLWFRNQKQKLQVLKDIGIDGPEPQLLYGNLKHVQDKGLRNHLVDWTKQYGKTYGYYEGAHKPIIVTSDLELLKDVFIKEFNNFRSRKELFAQSKKYMSVFNADGDKWKRLRSITSPTFSSAKMKMMSPLVNGVVDRLVKLFDVKAKEGQPIDIQEIFQRFTMDGISCCAFGMDGNAIDNPDDIFLFKGREVFKIIAAATRNKFFMFLSMLDLAVPGFFYFLRNSMPDSVQQMIENSLFNRSWFYSTAQKIIEERQSSPIKRPDFIQLMLEAEASDDTKDEELAASIDEKDYKEHSIGKSCNTHETKTKLKMRREEMQGQSLVFLLAGYETTSTALSYIAYDLALNPQVQETLHQEIETFYPGNECRPDCSSVQKLPYLDMVVCESLRLHTIASLVANRQAQQSLTIRGQHIPAGVHIQPDTLSIHTDPEHWGPEDTALYVPERFLPERKAARHPLAWMPFGAGPRNCVGMRFALMEIKIALVRILKLFVIKKCEKTKIPLPVNKNGVASPSEGVTVVMERRQ